MNRAAVLVLLAMLTAGGVVSAQEETVAPEGESAEQGTGDDAEDGATPANPAPATDPFDYQSSEQISEDLSVSFPVDI